MGEGPRGDTRFESAMRHSAVGMCLIAPDGAFLEVNEALCTMLGRDEATLRAATWQEMTHPEDVQADAALVLDVLEGRRDSYRLAKRYLRPDGSVVHGDLSVVGMRDEHGALDYFISQVVDTTAQVRLRDRYRLLAENATDIVALGDNDGVVRWISESVQRVIGWARSDIEGRPWAEFIHPDDLPVMRANQEALRAGQRVEMELRFRSGSGAYRWASFRVRPVIGEDGTVQGRVASWWDAEESHRAAQALRRSEERFRASLEAQADVHIFFDAVRDDDGRVVDMVLTDANQAAFDFLGMDRESAVGSRVFSDLPHDHVQPLIAAYAHTIETGEPLVIDEWRTVPPPGEEPRVFDLRGVRVGDGLSVSAREVTDRVHALQALETSERQARDLAQRYERARDEALEASAAKTVFLSRMSHELRTPLNAILGFAQLLELEHLTTDQRDFVGHIRAGGRHLLGLVTEVLDVSRIESGMLSLSLEPVDVADAVGEAVNLVKGLAAGALVTVRRRACPDGGAFVHADRQRLIQVLVNLLSNGVKYNRPGGTVDVVCEPLDADRLAIRVVDTGPGIAPEHLPRLFEPFDRLGAEQTSVEGTGIGLALSQGLARVMSGHIEVASVPGEGSTFSVVLPRAQAVGDGVPQQEVVARLVAEHAADVLYIEDNPANRTLMERIVRLRPAATLRLAPNGRAGLSAAAERTPDLVLLDLHLPDIQGDEVLQRIRAQPALAHVTVVVVTADASPASEERLRRLGADGIVIKPVDVEDVLEWIDSATARGR